LIPNYLGFDPTRFVLALEDLSDWVVWRSALNTGEIHSGIAAQVGEYVARMAFATSVFGMSPEEVQRSSADAVNPDLCRITEDLVFTEPYLEHEHNVFVPELGPEIAILRTDDALVSEVGSLKYTFMTVGEALIHGDLHTGSVMVSRWPDGSGRGKVFDSEFCYYGPVGFDLGALFGNYLLALARARVIGRPNEFVTWVEGLPADTWESFVASINRHWADRADRFLSDQFFEGWLRNTWEDAVGFGGCKAIRRIVGPAKVSDVETLPLAEHVLAGTMVLRTARRWILERSQIPSPAALMEVASEVWSDLSTSRIG
jgi:5-methylthioribose kinase